MLEVEPLGIVQLTFVVLFCSRWSSKHTQLPPHFGAGIFIVVALTLVPQNVYWMLTSLNLHLNNIQQPLIDATVHVCACNLHPLSTELLSHFIYLFIWASYFPRFSFISLNCQFHFYDNEMGQWFFMEFFELVWLYLFGLRNFLPKRKISHRSRNHFTEIDLGQWNGNQMGNWLFQVDLFSETWCQSLFFFRKAHLRGMLLKRNYYSKLSSNMNVIQPMCSPSKKLQSSKYHEFCLCFYTCFYT